MQNKKTTSIKDGGNIQPKSKKTASSQAGDTKKSQTKDTIKTSAQSNNSKTPEQVSGAKTPNKKKSLITLSAICGCVLLVVIVTIFLASQKKSDITTEKIMTSLSKKITTITYVINYSEANDPNGIMGQANQYTSKSSWEDSRIKDHISEYAGTIEVFNNVKDAELREWKINATAEACELHLTKEKYGTSFKSGFNCKEYYMFRKNSVVVRLSLSFNEKQLSEYKETLSSIIDSYQTPEIDIPTAERISELREEHEETLESSTAEAEKEIQKGLDEILASYNDKLDAISESLNEDELASAKSELNTFKEASYFSSKIAGLEQKINAIDQKIADKKREEKEAAARAEQEKLAQKNHTLGTGKYTTCVDIDSGTYDVKAVSGSGNLFVDSDSYSHYVNEVMNTTGAYGWTTEYKNMILSCGDVLELKNGLTVQLTAKR